MLQDKNSTKLTFCLFFFFHFQKKEFKGDLYTWIFPGEYAWCWEHMPNKGTDRLTTLTQPWALVGNLATFTHSLNFYGTQTIPPGGVDQVRGLEIAKWSYGQQIQCLEFRPLPIKKGVSWVWHETETLGEPWNLQEIISSLPLFPCPPWPEVEVKCSLWVK